jgi:ankyrin repeat protein
MKRKMIDLLYISVIMNLVYHFEFSILFLAIDCNEEEIAKLLIDKKEFNINAKDKDGRTALHLGIFKE